MCHHHRYSKNVPAKILVKLKDTDFQWIVWRRSADEPIHDYRLLAVTYGTSSCAPYLAIRTLRKLAHDEKQRHPLASVALLHDKLIY